MAQDPRLLKNAASMRHDATQFEVILWRHLSQSQLGFKFRRQHVVGDRIVDFFCPAKSLALEVDGDTHDAEETAIRDAELIGMGITVLHVCNQDVAENMDGVLTSIIARLESLPNRWPHPIPSPKGDGLNVERS